MLRPAAFVSGNVADFGAIQVEFTNLDKVLYPATGTAKREVIDYYIAIAPVLLPHIADRPLTRKRWPNGVENTSFFEKNLPEHAPGWIPRHIIEHSQRPVTYPVFDSVACLAWAGQQAALELHVPQWRFAAGQAHHPTRPGDSDGADGMGMATRLVFDLDPGPGAGLDQCARVALLVRDILSEVGLQAFPLTSGSKGIHLYVPLAPPLPSTAASAVARQVAANLAALHPDLVTATMAKQARTGKVFLDWSQNNSSKTTVAPYSLRGRTRPAVAAPRHWDELAAGNQLRQLLFDEVLDRVAAEGDLLAGLDELPPSPLDTYRAMRNAAHTPEPVDVSLPAPGANDRFVIQEHHARRLHYDVRLERDGVLVSWAVPKGPPETSGQNRLAVHTEDHPLEYLTFHGSIPKGQYGAGEMTIWDSGTYETEKWRVPAGDDGDKGEVIVRLRGEKVNGRYAFIQTGEKNWLLHYMRDQRAPGESADAPELPRGLMPMLATSADVSECDSAEWYFETKLDGHRLIMEVADGQMILRSRNGNVVTERFPGLAPIASQLAGHRAVLDGEVVVADSAGHTDIGSLQRHPERAEFVAFDLLFLDGTSLVRKPLADRRQVLEALGAVAPALRISELVAGSGAQALAISKEHGQEGVIAKRKDSVYQPGKRARTWLKTKNWRTQDVVIGGWRASERGRSLGALLMGMPEGGHLRYVGRVGGGFTESALDDVAGRLKELATSDDPFAGAVPAADRKGASWVRPVLVAEVRYQGVTPDGRLRHPTWRGLREHLTPEQIEQE